MMTKKDFIALADAIKHDLWPYECTSRQVVECLATFCHSRNPRFNRNRWLGYIRGECGPNGGRIRKSKGGA
jgi:hypothetical protein